LFSFSNAAPRRNAHIGVNSTPTCLHIASVLVFRSEISTFALCAGSKNRESLSSIICVQVHRGVAICGADESNLCALLDHTLCIVSSHLMLKLVTTMPIIHDYWFSFIFI
jgi:hypothetical protein